MTSKLFEKKIYFNIVATLILVPNIFVAIIGIETFPYTCAPMFGHYIDDNTNLYLLKFEGVNDSTKTNLTEFYGKSEDLFIRHFFSKVYGSTHAISPFDSKLSESKSDFQYRMDTFFNHFSTFILSEYNLSFDQINLSVKNVDQNRNIITDFKPIGYFDYSDKKYHTFYENSN
ncbi:hypothetical protein [Hwangdonia lutea]|uniref:Uncharacterized protein n=1 Tax=Hwangdonia lutea TaxID=3075823 RepID=A0AA97HRF0_9FLAO|nr:hypothetical protein [Hwangdonia sp. SCSIO 19198]WOD43383.1 hypothetical protein RNZ46_15445 [Hwangdonia sp. SCSIO 19198]